MINIEVIESMGHWLEILRTNDELYVIEDTGERAPLLLYDISVAQANWFYDTFVKANDILLAVQVLKYGKNFEPATLTELGFNFEEIGL